MTPKAALVLLISLVLVSACRTRPQKVDCDGRLSPINAPAPVTQESEKRP